MKISNKLLIVVFCMGLCTACSDFGDDLTDDLKSGKLGASKDGETKMVTVPFKADFSVGRLLPPGEGESCGEDMSRETMGGGGNITHLGKMTTFMTFCVVNGTGEYSFSELGYFVAANGDSLYFNIPIGQVLPGADKEGYHAHFNDAIYFMSGTGRFKGATGKALTNAYVDADTDGDGPDEFRTDFFSEGTITMMKGKR
jgi:hypothetical protein